MFGLRVLSFASLLGCLQAVILTIKDPRQPSNATKDAVKDAQGMCFFGFFHAMRVLFGSSTADADETGAG